MVDKHAISPLNQQDKTPGQHTEDRSVKRPSTDLRDVRFLEEWVWPGLLLQQFPPCILLVQKKCRRQRRLR
jgi:hypothetical protein